MKRVLDVVVSFVGLVVASAVLVPAMIAIWLQDRCSPFYVATRAGAGGEPFRMVKLRSMRILSDATGVMSTAGDDPRITAVGRFVRRWKLDEMTQLWNVLKGDMTLVGPRPQVLQDVALYTEEEQRLLSVRPGITDMASIVFADEGDILRGADDPDLRYQQIIRPWKSRLALLYVDRGGSRVTVDIKLLWLTVMNSFSRDRALAGVAVMVERLGGGVELVRLARRSAALKPAPPPGAAEVFARGAGAAGA
jgi:lipopolysaccharide/colanic/teichoic acid biosynthesis glycosyltransferase